jgi:hypothetical protein
MAQLIAGRETVEHAWHIFNYMAAQLPSPAGYRDAVSGSGVTVLSATPPDARIKELGSSIARDEEEQEQFQTAASVSQLRKRVHLSELIGRYIKETKARGDESRSIKRKLVGRPSVHDRFVDILFPETVEWKNKDMQNNPREKAKTTFKYWIQLGEPLAKMAQRFGVGILLRLPTNLTDT